MPDRGRPEPTESRRRSVREPLPNGPARPTELTVVASSSSTALFVALPSDQTRTPQPQAEKAPSTRLARSPDTRAQPVGDAKGAASGGRSTVCRYRTSNVGDPGPTGRPSTNTYTKNQTIQPMMKAIVYGNMVPIIVPIPNRRS